MATGPAGWSLRFKFAALLIAATLLPLAILAMVDLHAAQAQRVESLQDLLGARGDQIVNELDRFHATNRTSVDRIATFPDVVQYCGQRVASADVRAGALGILRAYPGGNKDIRGVGILDPNGQVVLATEPAMVGVDLSHQSHVQAALGGARVTSNIFIGVPQVAEEPSIAYLAPILGSGGHIDCVVALWFRASALWATVKASDALAGAGSFAVVFDQHGIRIAHTYSDDIVFHPGGRLPEKTLKEQVAERRFGLRTQSLLEDVRGFPEQFELSRAALPSRSVFHGYAPLTQGWTYGVARRFATVPWTVFYMVPQATFDAPLAALRREKLLLAAAAMLAAGAASLVAASRVLRPIRKLSQATMAIAAGDLSARVERHGTDELGRLAANFNEMAVRVQAQAVELQAARDQFEQRVEQRTAELTQAVGTLQAEIAARLRIETTLSERDAGLRRAQTVARLAHVITDADGAFISWSESLPQMVGVPPADMPVTTRAWLDCLHPEDRPVFRQMSIEAATQGHRVDVDYRLQHGLGHWVHVHQVNEPLQGTQDINGKFNWFCTLQDVTEQYLAQQGLRDSEMRFRQLAETIDDVFWVTTPDFTQVLYLSPAFERVWGRPAEEVLRDPQVWLDSIHVDDRDRVVPEVERTRSDPVAFTREYRIRRPDGSIRWVLNRGYPVLDEAGHTVRVNGVATDVTERRREEVLIQQFAAIVASSDDAIIGKTLDGVITSWNPGAERLFGHTAAEAVGRTMMIIIPPDRNQEEPAILARIAQGESVDHFETVRLKKDGARIHVSATISPIRDARGVVVGASKIARDITERKLGEIRLQAQLERLSLLDQITAAIGERQDLGSIYNVAMRSTEERLPADFSCVLSHEDGAATMTVVGFGAHSHGRALAMGLASRDAVSVDANGLAKCLAGELVYEADLSDLEFAFPRRLCLGGLKSMVLAPLRSESRVFGVLVVAREAARAFSSGECEFLRQLSAHIGLAAQQARLYEALQAAYDELRQTQQAVMQQERLRALGQMASGIAHDINNAISPILLYTETLLEREPDLSDRSRRYLQTIAQSIDDVAATVARLREFYRQREPQLALLPIRLNELVTQVSELTRARWSDMPLEAGVVIRMEQDLEAGLPDAAGVDSEVREALMNLVFNAVDAMPDGGTLTLRTRSGAPPDTPSAAPRLVHVEVADTGVGMDEDTRRRCLEPFFTTKGERGTGLGLAMVYGIAQRHGADIEIDSAPEHGTCVRLSFPLAEQRPIASASAPARALPMRHLRILIVDDDPIVLQSLRDTLEAEGHAVVSADGGKTGIEEFREALTRGACFDAVITDLGMPHVDGRQVAAAVKQASAHTPVVMLTGWGQRLLSEDTSPEHVDRLLGKPPKLREIRIALRELVTPTPRVETPPTRLEGKQT